MKFHYRGKYNLDPESLPAKPHKPNAVAFKEPEDSKTLGAIANTIGIIIIIAAIAGIWFRWSIASFHIYHWVIACVLQFFSLFPHELLHAVCFKEDVYMYTNFSHGMLFVVGTEDFSKAGFIFMSILPTLLFGVIPYIVCMFVHVPILDAFAALSLGAGAGDFLNVFNAASQMPKGSRTYMHGFHSYWYIPENH